jgi:cytochrome c-type protein NapC
LKTWWKSQSGPKKILFVVLFLVGVFGVFIVLPTAGWIIGTEAIAATSDAEFCGGCHTMEPFVKANADSVHGGDNPWGIKAECVDCHLPHNNAFNYLTTKIRRGGYDIWYQTFHDTSDIDWKAKDDDREDFLFDSGCLSCHDNLHEATAGFAPHDNYFAGKTESKCVTCHNDIGHSNVNKYYLEHKYRE